MNNKKQNLFEIPLWHIKVSNFSEKKKQIEDLFQEYKEEKTGIQNFFTNKSKIKNPSVNAKFVDILTKEIELISQEVKSDVGLIDVWTLSYENGDYHTPHCHGHSGITAILYLNLPENSPNTTYIQPWIDIKTNVTKQLNIDVKEGDIVVVPSFILHFSSPNKSDKIKRIVSWDMKIV